MIRFIVPGEPQPQGNVTAFNDKGGRARITHKNPSALQAFRADCRAAAAAVGAEIIGDLPVMVEVAFVLKRPKIHYRAGGVELKEWAPTFHTGQRPDADKLLRALLDALTAVCFRDDGQVVDVHLVKRYVREREAPHSAVEIEVLPEREESD